MLVSDLPAVFPETTPYGKSKEKRCQGTEASCFLIANTTLCLCVCASTDVVVALFVVLFETSLHDAVHLKDSAESTVYNPACVGNK